MTVFTMKTIACLIMLADHCGAILFPGTDWLRALGRVAFPLFAWLLANGMEHTRSHPRYLLRLLLFAVLSQLPYILAFRPENLRFNVFFTLTLGLLCLQWRQQTCRSLGTAGVLFAAAVAEYFAFDHGAYGILSIYLFGAYHNSFGVMAVAQTALVAVRQIAVYSLAWHGVLGFSEWWVWAQPLSLASLGIILLYNGEQGFKKKYLFYWFYPLHLVILYCLKNRLL